MKIKRILIAEDDKMTRIILRQQLKKWGYDILEAENGQQAYEILTADNPPSIAILDWIMPEMSGIEVCKQLENDDQNKTYIIVLTSKDTNEDIVEALEAGADDFISKPVNSAVLHSRLNVAKRTTEYRNKLASYAHEMEDLAQQRAEQLVHADRLVTIGTMASSIVHEINNPLSVISSTNQIFSQYWKKLEPLVKKAIEDNSEDKSFLEYVLTDFPQMTDSLKNNITRINKIIGNLKRFYKKDSSNDKVQYSLNDCITNSLDICCAKLKNNVRVSTELDNDPLIILAIPHQIDQVIVNIIVNACEAIINKNNMKTQGNIKIITKHENNKALIIIENDGGAIPQEILEKIWSSFFTTKSEGTGLGLSISMEIIKAHGGEMLVENLPDSINVRFTIILPLQDK